jgi:hypothetical protein
VSETTEQAGRLIGEPGGGPGPGSSVGDILRHWGGVFVRQREATVFVVAVALLLYFGLSNASSFISQANAINLFSEIAAPIIIIAVGEVLLLICGEIDLSVGFIYTFAPFMMFFMNEYYGVPAWRSSCRTPSPTPYRRPRSISGSTSLPTDGLRSSGP